MHGTSIWRRYRRIILFGQIYTIIVAQGHAKNQCTLSYLHVCIVYSTSIPHKTNRCFVMFLLTTISDFTFIVHVNVTYTQTHSTIKSLSLQFFFSSSLCIYLILAYRRCYGQKLERFLCTQTHPLIYSERGRERENGNKRTHLSNIVAIAIIKHRRRHCKRHRRRRLFYLVSLIGGVIW